MIHSNLWDPISIGEGNECQWGCWATKEGRLWATKEGRLWDCMSVGEENNGKENETLFIRVWKPWAKTRKWTPKEDNIPRYDGGSVARHEHELRGSWATQANRLTLLQHRDKREKVVKVALLSTSLVGWLEDRPEFTWALAGPGVLASGGT